MQYHFSFDVNFINGTELHKVAHDGQMIAEDRVMKTMPKNFQAIGDERVGFDVSQFIMDTNPDKFQYIDSKGGYSTVTIYDHNPQYLTELSSLEGNDAFIDEMLDHLVVQNNHLHSEFDFVI